MRQSGAQKAGALVPCSANQIADVVTCNVYKLCSHLNENENENQKHSFIEQSHTDSVIHLNSLEQSQHISTKTQPIREFNVKYSSLPF